MKYSPSSGCFYPEWGQYSILPTDLIDVTEEEFKTAISRPAGHILVVVDGRVTVAPPPPLPRSEIESVVARMIREERSSRYSGGVRVDGLWYPSDADFRLMYLDWKDQARDQLAAGGVKTDALLVDDSAAEIERLDGGTQAITIDLIFTLVDKVRRLRKKLDVASATHIMQMKASPDPAAYDYISTLWPNRYTQP